MDVKAENLLFENVLSKGQYIIPDYQREYDWEDSEIDEFLEDIGELEPAEHYFIGHMVFEGDFNGTTFNVIDGQQRITTITILLCVIRDLLYSKESEKLANALNDKYIFNKNKDGEEFEVLRNDMPYPVLQSYVQSIPKNKDKTKTPEKSGEKKIIKAYDKFIKLFSSYDENELITLRNKLFNLEVIFVAVKDSENNERVDAHEIFMTLNATGKDLTPLDLIKSRIFKLYPKQPHLNEPGDSWKEIIKNTEEKQKKFLNNFWSSRYKKVSDKRVFKEFIKEIIKPKKDIKIFFDNLLADSRIYKKINNPQKSDWNENEEFQVFFSLNAIINVFNVEVSNSILLSLIREYDNSNISLKYLLKALNYIEKFHFINNAINSNRSSGLDTMYARMARDLSNALDRHAKHKIIDEMGEKLKDKLPSKEEFSAKFDEKLFYLSKQSKQKKLVKYALRKLEYKQNPNAELINVSIEHIYPEKPEKNSIKLNIESVGNIGNLVLLDKNLNSDTRIGNKLFEIKKPIILSESHIITTKNVFNSNNTWNEEKIKNRRDILISDLYESVWD